MVHLIGSLGWFIGLFHWLVHLVGSLVDSLGWFIGWFIWSFRLVGSFCWIIWLVHLVYDFDWFGWRKAQRGHIIAIRVLCWDNLLYFPNSVSYKGSDGGQKSRDTETEWGYGHLPPEIMTSSKRYKYQCFSNLGL